MYYCEDCGCSFEYPGSFPEVHDELPGRPVELFSVCPECGGDDFGEVDTCHICGKPSPDVKDSLPICKDCAEELKNSFESLLRDTFNEREIAYLNEIYDGKTFGMEE